MLCWCSGWTIFAHPIWRFAPACGALHPPETVLGWDGELQLFGWEGGRIHSGGLWGLLATFLFNVVRAQATQHYRWYETLCVVHMPKTTQHNCWCTASVKERVGGGLADTPHLVLVFVLVAVAWKWRGGGGESAAPSGSPKGRPLPATHTHRRRLCRSRRFGRGGRFCRRHGGSF